MVRRSITLAVVGFGEIAIMDVEINKNEERAV